MIKYCQIMDHDSIVQDLVAPGDKVLSTVECSWNDSFRILALVEHPTWSGDVNTAAVPAAGRRGENESGQRSPDSREFAILFLDGRAPILTKNDMNAVHVIPVSGSAFTCEIDMESCGEDGEICVKLAPNLIEPEILVKMAPGNRSQNFIDEVFRAAQIATSSNITVASSDSPGTQDRTDRSNISPVETSDITSTITPSSGSATLSWLTYYEDLVRSSTNNFNNTTAGGAVSRGSSITSASSATANRANPSSEAAAATPHHHHHHQIHFDEPFLRASVSFLLKKKKNFQSLILPVHVTKEKGL